MTSETWRYDVDFKWFYFYTLDTMKETEKFANWAINYQNSVKPPPHRPEYLSFNLNFKLIFTLSIEWCCCHFPSFIHFVFFLHSVESFNWRILKENPFSLCRSQFSCSKVSNLRMDDTRWDLRKPENHNKFWSSYWPRRKWEWEDKRLILMQFENVARKRFPPNFSFSSYGIHTKHRRQKSTGWWWQ